MADENTYIKNEPLVYKFIYILGGGCLLIHLIQEWFFGIPSEPLQTVGFMTMSFYFFRRLYKLYKQKDKK